MILIYPMLISKSTSPNIIPGICKMLERYLLIYGMDKIFKKLGVKSVQSAASTLATAAKTVQPYLEQKQQYDPNQVKDEDDEDNKDKKKGKEKESPNKIDIPYKDAWSSLSVEPTWVQVTTKNSGTMILGIKVVPFPIESTGNIVDALANDKASKWFDYIGKKYSRIVIRLYNQIMRKLPWNNRAITGSVNDIVWASSEFGENVFLALNKLDMSDSVLANKPSTVKKLYSLGWNSIVLADDVNKEVTFCMTEFKGLCSVVPYGFIYSTLGSTHQKVYDNMDDAKKSAGPFFHLSSRASRVLGEAYRNRKMAEYVLKRRRREVISEDVKNFVKSQDSSIISKISEIKDSLSSGNMKKAKQLADSVPQKMNEIHNDINKDEETRSNYQFAKNVIGKTMKFSPDVTEKLAAFATMVSSEAENSRDTIKEIIHKLYAAVSSKAGKELILAVMSFAWSTITWFLTKRAMFGLRTSSTTLLPIWNAIKAAYEVSGITKMFSKDLVRVIGERLIAVGRHYWWLLLILLVIYIVSDMLRSSEDDDNE